MRSSCARAIDRHYRAIDRPRIRDRSVGSGDRPAVTRLAFVLPLAIDRLVRANDRRNLCPKSSLERSIGNNTRSIGCVSGKRSRVGSYAGDRSASSGDRPACSADRSACSGDRPALPLPKLLLIFVLLFFGLKIIFNCIKKHEMKINK